MPDILAGRPPQVGPHDPTQDRLTPSNRNNAARSLPKVATEKWPGRAPKISDTPEPPIPIPSQFPQTYPQLTDSEKMITLLARVVDLLSSIEGKRQFRAVIEFNLPFGQSFTWNPPIREIPDRWVIWSELTATAADALRVSEGGSTTARSAAALPQTVENVFQVIAGKTLTLTARDKQITILNGAVANTIHVFVAAIGQGELMIQA